MLVETQWHGTKESNMRTELNKRVKLRLTAEERIIFRETSLVDHVASTAVELIIELGQAVGIGLEIATEKHFWFDIETRQLRNKAPDPDLGNPATDVWIAVKARTNWSDSFSDVIDLPIVEGTLMTSYSPGKSNEVLARRIDAKDRDGRAISQLLVATVTFVTAMPAHE
jgi:hypothetical protein